MPYPLALCLLAFSAACQPASEPAAFRSQLGPEVGPGSGQGSGRPSATFDHSHGLWNTILREHVEGDRFDYAGLEADRAKLDAYLAELAAVTPATLLSWSEAQRFAFWINAYNAFTVERVVDAYPLQSIRDLDKLLGLASVFEQRFIPLNALHPEGKDEKLSLEDIEHRILRVRFRDARLHAAINCASESCPPLANEAFVAERLNEQLETRMRAFLADSKRNRFDHEKNRLLLSPIFKWFDGDFERDAGSVRAYVARFAPAGEAELVERAKIDYLDYSWDLNDARAE